MDKEIKEILLESVYGISRWNEEETFLMPALTVAEAENVCEIIVEELEKNGYQITKK